MEVEYKSKGWKFFFDWLIVAALVFLLLDLGSTYYCSGQSLQYEGNILVSKYGFGWIGLVVVLSLFCFLDILLYAVHRYLQGSVFDVVKHSTSFLGWLSLYWFGVESATFGLAKLATKHTAKHFAYAVLNFIGFFRIRLYVLYRAAVVTNNILLGIVYNHARIDIDNAQRHTTLHIDSSPI
jgi:hypothetical protein